MKENSYDSINTANETFLYLWIRKTIYFIIICFITNNRLSVDDRKDDIAKEAITEKNTDYT